MNLSYFSGLTGEVITPDSPFYNEERQEYNRRIQKFPLAIVLCDSSFDVTNAVLWCRKHGVSLRIRNGRHNYEGYSVGNDVLVIDVSRMNRMKIDETNQLFYAEGGVNVRELYDFVSSRGYPFPGGSCPTVGLAGYTLGGGWGYSARHLGLGCDSLAEITLVNYKGELITASHRKNSDLFWACCGGGGGSYGVVVSMVFYLPPKINSVTYVEIHYPCTNKKLQVEFINVWQNWLEGADDRMTLTTVISNSAENGLGIFSRGLFYGNPVEAKAILEPFSCLGGDVLAESMSFLDALIKIGSVYPESEVFKTTGRFVYDNLCKEEAIDLIDFIQNPPKGSVLVGFTLFSMGGKIAEVCSRSTAFYYRNSKYLVAIQAVWEERRFEKANIQWVEQGFEYLKYITRGSYVNFPYNELQNYPCNYYGNNDLELEQIKKKYDPHNVFCFPQSIPIFRKE